MAGEHDEQKRINNKEILDVVATALPAVISVVMPPVGAFLAWVESTNNKIFQENIEKTLQEYAKKFEVLDEAQKKLESLVATREGRVLFHKFLRINNNGDGDDEWASLLANTLKNISISSIEESFAHHNFLLSQIEKLSPQALIIISRYDKWHYGNIQNTTTTSSTTLGGDWDIQITEYFFRESGFSDPQIKTRIRHAFKELENSNMIVLDGHQVAFTDTGSEIHRIITS